MKEIQLSQGLVARVDDADFEYLNQWKWHAGKRHNTWYAVNKNKDYMHKLLLTAPLVDHRDGDGLNNQRYNLRPATISQSNINKMRGKDNTSGFKGVSWHLHNKKWRSQIQVRGKNIHIGCYLNVLDAASAYDAAAQHYFGEFARLNFIYDPACYI